MSWDIFDSVLGTFDALGDVAVDFVSGVGDFVSVFSDDDSVWGSISNLAGTFLQEGARGYLSYKAAEAAGEAGESEANIFYGNADLFFDEAARVEGRTERSAILARLQGLKILSKQTAAYSAAGVQLEGSPLLVLEETQDLIDIEIDRIFEEGTAKAETLRAQALIEQDKAENALDRAAFEAELVMTESLMGAGTRLLGLD